MGTIREGVGSTAAARDRAAVTAALTVALTTTLGACGEAGEESSWQGEVRDSAGVTIVENRGDGVWGASEAWTLRPVLEVGGDESRPETLFGQVADAAVDDDGRLYVLDQQAATVRVFDREGGHLRNLGSPGEGPGELSGFAWSLMLLGDTVVVADWGRRGLHRFLTDGAVLESVPFPGPSGSAARSWWSVGADGRIYARSIARFTRDDGSWSGRDALLRLDSLSAEPDTVVVFEYEEADLGQPGEPRVPVLINAPMWTVLPDGRVAWTTLQRERVRLLGRDGSLERLVGREAWRPPAPDEGHAADFEAGLREKARILGADPDLIMSLPVDMPERLPAVTSLRAGPEGTLWVERMGQVADVHPMALNSVEPPVGWGGPVWDVLDADGRYLGSVTMPDRFRVTRVTSGAVVGVQRDELDVERVFVLALER